MCPATVSVSVRMTSVCMKSMILAALATSCCFATFAGAQQETVEAPIDLAEVELLYSASRKSLDADYRREVKRLDRKYLEELSEKRSKLIEILESALKQAASDVRLDDVVKLKKKIEAVKDQALVPPKDAVAEREFKLQQKIGLLKAEVQSRPQDAMHEPQIPDDAAEYNGHWYRVIDQKVTHRVAALRASEAGGYLARVDDAEEHEFLVELIRRGKTSFYFIDGTDDEKPNQWMFSNGLPVPYLRWDSRQPEKGRGQWFLSISRTSCRFHDLFCAELSGYIIEWERPVEPSSFPETGERFFDVQE